MKKLKSVLTCFLLAVTALSAQNIQVKGTVTDASTGEAVPFASVLIKGTTTGTSTDGDGMYVLSAPAQATLIFSSIGYQTQEVAVGGRTVVNCLLAADTEYLDDVLVVAYGTAKKESFTGSAQTIKSDQR